MNGQVSDLSMPQLLKMAAENRDLVSICLTTALETVHLLHPATLDGNKDTTLSNPPKETESGLLSKIGNELRNTRTDLQSLNGKLAIIKGLMV